MEAEQMARLTWRKRPTRDGMMRMQPSYSLHNGSDKHLAIAQETSGGWYWYGDGQNTAHNLRPLDEVKAEAERHFRAKSA